MWEGRQAGRQAREVFFILLSDRAARRTLLCEREARADLARMVEIVLEVLMSKNYIRFYERVNFNLSKKSK
jgi:hypothetical protein